MFINWILLLKLDLYWKYLYYIFMGISMCLQSYWNHVGTWCRGEICICQPLDAT